MRFRDRNDAARQIAGRLFQFAHRSDVLVVAIQQAGLPIAFEVARLLGVPLEVQPVAAVRVADRPDIVFGAVAHDGVEVIDERVVSSAGIPRRLLEQVAVQTRLSLERSLLTLQSPSLTDLHDRTVLVVDDGLAVSTIPEAAILSIRRRGAKGIVVAAAVGRKDVAERLRTVAEHVICLRTPDPFTSIADEFDVYEPVLDSTVGELLGREGRRHQPLRDPVEVIRARAQRVGGDASDYDALIDGIGDARLVLLGESTHGTHEFYRERATITKRLIQEKQFTAVAVEADWPDAYRVNRYVRGAGLDVDAVDALEGFRRFPTWMWRNADVLDFVGWLRARNDGRAADQRTGFYGLDLYSLRASIAAVLEYLGKVDAAAAERARQRYACFDRFDGEPQAYAHATATGMIPSCEREVVGQLLDLHRRRADYASRNGRIAPDDYFFAEQNARLVRNAEEYYRTMLRGRAESWNIRDRHMAQTLEALLAYLEGTRSGARIVVWAHNSHIGDARATQMGEEGEVNLGQLVRERFGSDAVLVGLTTSGGTVTASSAWDGPAQRRELRAPVPGSYERLFHGTGISRFLLSLRSDPELARAVAMTRLERAVGVLYLPETERASHYFHARLSSQFDYVLHFDQTRAVEPLEPTSDWDVREVAETYPSGL